jgi:nitrogenase molybdenum-iron protein beta chain
LNSLFGAGQTVENWKKVALAELNLVVSPWGLEIAEYLEKEFGMPYINWMYLPVGVDDVKDLFLEISQIIELDELRLENVTKEADVEFNYFLEQFADAYFNLNFQVEFAAVGTTSQVLGVSRFLSNVLGLVPRALVLTDNLPNGSRAGIDKFLAKVNVKPRMLFSEDSQEISSFLKQEKATLILASALEKDVANELASAHLSVSFPIGDRIILNRGYSGYAGGLNLMEDIGSVLVRNKMSEFRVLAS